jgi:hypothetical protein
MRKWYAAAVIVIVLAGLVAVWQLVYHGVSPRLIVFPPPVEKPPPAALDELASVNATECPLRGVLDVLSQQHNVNITLDAAALKNSNLTGGELVTCHLSGVSLRSMLNLLVRQVDSDLIVLARDGEILVTTLSHWSSTLNNYVSRVHLLTPLLTGPRELNEASLVTLIKETIALGTWSDNFGAGVIEALPGALVICQTPDVHEQIADLLRVFAELPHSDSLTSLPIGETCAQQNAAVTRALDGPAVIQVSAAPLSTIARQLSDTHGITIWVNEPALSRVGISRDARLTCAVKNVSLRAALRLLLRESELTFVVRDGILVVTTPAEAQERLTLRAYPVGDLVQPSVGIDGDSPAEFVKGAVAPQSWGDVGGPGSLAYCSGALLVSQTGEVHENLERMLYELRFAMHPAGLPMPPPEATAQQRMRATLQKRVSFNYTEAPLTDVLQALAGQTGVNIQIDTRALDGVGIPTNTPVTFAARDEPFRAALRSLLTTLELSFVFRDEVLLVTTLEESESHLITKFYRFRRFPRSDPWGYEPQELAELITLCTIFAGPIPTASWCISSTSLGNWPSWSSIPLHGNRGTTSPGRGLCITCQERWSFRILCRRTAVLRICWPHSANRSPFRTTLLRSRFVTRPGRVINDFPHHCRRKSPSPSTASRWKTR